MAVPKTAIFGYMPGLSVLQLSIAPLSGNGPLIAENKTFVESDTPGIYRGVFTEVVQKTTYNVLISRTDSGKQIGNGRIDLDEVEDDYQIYGDGPTPYQVSAAINADGGSESPIRPA